MIIEIESILFPKITTNDAIDKGIAIIRISLNIFHALFFKFKTFKYKSDLFFLSVKIYLKNIYPKLKIVATDAAIIADLAIISVLKLVFLDTNSTVKIVRLVFIACSKVKDIADIFIFCFPLKYPLITADIDTKNMDGAKIFKISDAASISNKFSAIKFEEAYKTKLHKKPTKEKIAIDTLNTLLAPFISPIDKFSATNFDTAFGIPIEDIVRNIVPAIAEKYIKEEIERLKNDE